MRLTERQKFREQVEPFLEPGERLIGAFVAVGSKRHGVECYGLISFGFSATR